MTPSVSPTSGWEKASTIAQWFQALAVVISLIFIASQLQQQAKLQSASNVQSLAELMTSLNLRLTEPHQAALWEFGVDEINKTADPRERAIKESEYLTLLATFLIFYENVYSQYQEGLLKKNIYLGWDRDLELLIRDHPIEKYWDDWKDAYQEDFRKHVDTIVMRKLGAVTPSS